MSNTRHLAPRRDFWIAFGGRCPQQPKPQLPEMVFASHSDNKNLSPTSRCRPSLIPDKGENPSDTHRAAFPITAVAIEVIKIIAVPDSPEQWLLGAGNAACFTLLGMGKRGRFTHSLTVGCIPTPDNLHSGARLERERERPVPLSQPACFYARFGFAIN